MENHNNILSNRYRQLAAQLAGIDAGSAARKSAASATSFSFPSKEVMCTCLPLLTHSGTRTDFAR